MSVETSDDIGYTSFMSFYSRPLIAWTEKGLYCEAGDFYIDPHRKVATALVTHAHSDHARRGSDRYLTVHCGLGLLKARLGKKIVAEGFDYQESFILKDVRVSFHSAGHILGSCQVRVESLITGEVWVASGDYKRDPDPSCHPFETVRCDTLITEATFGTPKFVWPKEINHGQMIADWWKETSSQNKNAVLFGYSLGKAQRILAELAPYAKKPVLIYDTIDELTECYRAEGRVLAPTRLLNDSLKALAHGDCLKGELIVAPPSILREQWADRLGEYETAFASGWMQGSGRGWGGNYDRGFVMSDHADWNDLNQTIIESGARRVFVQHREGVLIRHLRKLGIEAHSSDELTYENYARLGGQTMSLFE
jgi:putative mRNA 3-end processing factor